MQALNADHLQPLGWVRPIHYPRCWTNPAHRLPGVSDYERLVELAAKGMAERDNHPMPKSVTTPEAFYEVMARSALDAVGLQALLEELARAEQQLNADEGLTPLVDADGDTTLPVEEPFTTATHTGYENGVFDAWSRRERGTSKADRARLRRDWTTAAEERLDVVTAAVKRLRTVFNIAWETPSEASGEVASEVVTGCDGLTQWMSSNRAPRGLGKAEAELGAAAGVYRNAAVVYRNLEDVDEHQRWVRSNACARLLEQGDYHVETFVAAVAKRLSDDDAVEKRFAGRESKMAGAHP